MLILILIPPVVVVAAFVALQRRAVITVGVNEQVAVVAVARHTRGCRVLGLLVGLIASGAVLGFGQWVDGLGRLAALAPALLGSGVLLGAIIGELTAPASAGVIRTALVETRRVRDTLPAGRTAVLGLGSVLLLGALGAGAGWGSPDDLGRPGRRFAVECVRVIDGLGPTTVGHARGPFPGSFYGLPLAIAMFVLGALFLVALRTVARRPRPGLNGVGLDTVLRRWSVSTILGAGVMTVLGTLAPVAVFLGAGLDGGDCGLSTAQTIVKVAATVVAPLAAGGAAAALVALVVTPRIRVEDLPRPLPGDAAPVGAPVR